jgi:hypothetical protein
MSRHRRTALLTLVSLISLLVLVGAALTSGSTDSMGQVGALGPAATAPGSGATTSAQPPSSTSSVTASSGVATTLLATTTTEATTTTTQPISDNDCPSSPHAAVVDRVHQLAALCDHGLVVYRFPVTTAHNQPDPAVYKVYAKDLHATSQEGGHFSTMTHFVAFTRGKFKKARIAFHSVPLLRDGTQVQTNESVGTQEMWGASSGCIRSRMADSIRVWDWLQLGDQVHVIS